jgi:hypothetical protein
MTSSGIETATFWLIAEGLSQLLYLENKLPKGIFERSNYLIQAEI